jgi:hypothetical protein
LLTAHPSRLPSSRHGRFQLLRAATALKTIAWSKVTNLAGSQKAGVADANPFSDLTATPERLLADAESALKKAKLKGKYAVEVYKVNDAAD